MTDIKDINGLNIQGHIKIFDPVTNEVIVNKRT
jgi:hypothetical protein